MKATEFFRERDKPWSTCRSEAPDYTQPRCQAECEYARLRQDCDCRGLGDKRATQQLDDSLDYCTPILICRHFFEKECDCLPPPCHEIVYNVQTTVIPLAQNYFLKTDIDDALNEVVVRINYDALRWTVSTETKKQSLAGLLGAIGGMMGLWAGISMISLLELFGELFAFRIAPRLWGDRRLYGLGARMNPVRKQRIA